jgi:uncharacterized protein YjbI with pentapeptide repeats
MNLGATNLADANFDGANFGVANFDDANFDVANFDDSCIEFGLPLTLGEIKVLQLFQASSWYRLKLAAGATLEFYEGAK